MSSISLWLCSPSGPRPIFQFLNLYTVGRTPWMGDKPVARPLPTHRTTQTQKKRTHTCMPRVGFESTILVFERAKTVHALDWAASVIGTKCLRPLNHRHWDRGFESYSRNGYLSACILCLCCLVLVAALRHADHPSEESYKLCMSSELILNRNKSDSLIHQGRRSYQQACINCSVTRGSVSCTCSFQHNRKTSCSFQKPLLNKHFPWKQWQRSGRSTYRKNYCYLKQACAMPCRHNVLS
jgi:hypothetical protein